MYDLYPIFMYIHISSHMILSSLSFIHICNNLLLQFTAVNLSVAISAVRDNMGLFLVGLCVSGVGFVWLSIHVCACTIAHKTFGNWTLVFTIFSYYWVTQVLSNVVSVATTGIIGRWFLIGEKTGTLNTGAKVRVYRHNEIYALFLEG